MGVRTVRSSATAKIDLHHATRRPQGEHRIAQFPSYPIIASSLVSDQLISESPSQSSTIHHRKESRYRIQADERQRTGLSRSSEMDITNSKFRQTNDSNGSSSDLSGNSSNDNHSPNTQEQQMGQHTKGFSRKEMSVIAKFRRRLTDHHRSSSDDEHVSASSSDVVQSHCTAPDPPHQFVSNFTLTYSLSNDPCQKYRLDLFQDGHICDHRTWTSYYLYSYVFYMETHSQRFELSMNHTIGSRPSSPAAEQPAQTVPTYRWCEVKNPIQLDRNHMVSLPVPLDYEHIVHIHDRLSWDQIEWGPSGVRIAGREHPIHRIFFLSRQCVPDK